MRHGLQWLWLVEASGLAKCKVKTENMRFYCVYFNDLFRLHCFFELGPSRAMLQHQCQGAAGPGHFCLYLICLSVCGGLTHNSAEFAHCVLFTMCVSFLL
jgi:hypothetical protein